MLTRKKASDISPGLAVAGLASFLWATSCTVPLHPAGKAPGEEEEERTYVVIGSVFPYSWYVYWGPAFHEAAGQLPAEGKQWMNSSVSLVHRAFSFPYSAVTVSTLKSVHPPVLSPFHRRGEWELGCTFGCSPGSATATAGFTGIQEWGQVGIRN